MADVSVDRVSRIVESARTALAEFTAEEPTRPLAGNRSGDWWAGYFSATVESLLHLIDTTPGGFR